MIGIVSRSSCNLLHHSDDHQPDAIDETLVPISTEIL